VDGNSPPVTVRSTQPMRWPTWIIDEFGGWDRFQALLAALDKRQRPVRAATCTAWSASMVGRMRR
jgi:hypothetical protein